MGENCPAPLCVSAVAVGRTAAATTVGAAAAGATGEADAPLFAARPARGTTSARSTTGAAARGGTRSGSLFHTGHLQKLTSARAANSYRGRNLP